MVEKNMFEKNKDCPLLRFECFDHVQNIFDLCQALNM
jgi:hypothetical protein